MLNELQLYKIKIILLVIFFVLPLLRSKKLFFSYDSYYKTNLSYLINKKIQSNILLILKACVCIDLTVRLKNLYKRECDKEKTLKMVLIILKSCLSHTDTEKIVN